VSNYYHLLKHNAACELIDFQDGKWEVQFTKPNGEIVIEKVDKDQISTLNCYDQESSY